MTPEKDRIADYLETGQSGQLSPATEARLDDVRDLLSSGDFWAEPPSDLPDRITAEIAEAARPNWRWLWAAAGMVALVLAAVGLGNLLQADQPSPVSVVAMSGTELAPNAVATARLFPTPNGWAIYVDVTGLPAAPEGFYYQAWVSNGSEGISVGTFHMRGGEATPIGLWSGVDLREYPTINVTLQEVGAGPESSGELVITGTAIEFDGQ